MNQQDVLHHIVSPSSHLYIDGDHNTSVFNSCPIHNQKCHIGNEAYLYADETIKKLLNDVARALLFDLDYVPNQKDLLFINTYAHLYESDIIKHVEHYKVTKKSMPEEEEESTDTDLEEDKVDADNSDDDTDEDDDDEA